MKREIAILLAVIGLFLFLRKPILSAPFVLPFETGFQEAIALHHLEQGIAKNRFVPVSAVIDGKRFYHTAHPPLLHALYSVALRFPFARERLFRLFSLFLFTASVFLWRRLFGRGDAHSLWVYPLALFLPFSFLLCTTTNYEPLCLFMISLFAWLVLERRAGFLLLFPVMTLGLLSDWPFYLACPLLLVLERRDRRSRNLLMGLFLYEVLFFFALQGYYFSIAGESGFFGHAPARANPLALFHPGTWKELGSHFLELGGWQTCLAAAAAVAALAFSLLGTSSFPGKKIKKGVVFFAVFPFALTTAAPGLVSRHYVYLLYFTPLLVAAFSEAAERSGARSLLPAAAFALFMSRALVLSDFRNPTYFGMADHLRGVPIKTAFASSAVGTWKFYNGVETIHPVSAAAVKWLEKNKPDLLHLDLRSPEVAGFSRLPRENGYRLVFAVPGEEVFLKEELARLAPRWLTKESSPAADWKEPVSMFTLSGKGGPCPAGRWIPSFPYYGAGVKDCRAPVYALRQFPGPSGSSLRVRLSEEERGLSVKPAIAHATRFARSDGVMFFAAAEYDKKGEETELLFARFLREEEEGPRVRISLSGKGALILQTHPGPAGDFAFDDAYWTEPVFSGQ